jgi:hypothetical protein
LFDIDSDYCDFGNGFITYKDNLRN